MFDEFGYLRRGSFPTNHAEQMLVEEMHYPVRCACGEIYDLGRVTVTARYSDCSVWKTPCCKRVCDDRPEGWKSGPSYTRMEKI